MTDKYIINPFIIVNTDSNNYITTLIISLFLSPSSVDYLLKTGSNNGIVIYLQEIIKNNFIKNVRMSKSIIGNTVNNIKSCCYELGWKDSTVMILPQDINKFYLFLLDKLNGTYIKYKTDTVIDSISSSDGRELSVPYISLKLPQPDTEKYTDNITVKQLLHNWMYDDTCKMKKLVNINNKFEEVHVSSLNINNIVNSPIVLVLSVDRFKNSVINGINVTRKNSIKVDIQKKLSPFHNKYLFNKHEWIFHSVVCYEGDTMNSGYYYSLVCNNNEYYIFNNSNIPCLNKVNMDDPTITQKIKTDSVLLIYKIVN